MSTSKGSGKWPAFDASISIFARSKCPWIQQINKGIYPCSSWIFASTPQPIKNFAASILLFLHAKCKGVAKDELRISGFDPVLSSKSISDSAWPNDAALWIIELPLLSYNSDC